jgi:hypothetical protein
MCSGLIKSATDTVVAQFPDVEDVRKGVDSKFSPGPASNRPENKTSTDSQRQNSKELARRTNKIGEAIVKMWPQPAPLVVNGTYNLTIR